MTDNLLARIDNLERLRCAASIALDAREDFYCEASNTTLLTEVRDEIVKLRTLVAQLYSGVALYTDDGELQGGSRFPAIDFRRDSVEDIESKIKYRSEHDQTAS